MEKQSLWDGLKPWVGGFAVGAIAIIILGLSTGWTTKEEVAKQNAKTTEATLKIVAVKLLAPKCAKLAEANPEVVAEIATASSYQRSSKITEVGWATFDDWELSSTNTRALADACAKLIFDQAA